MELIVLTGFENLDRFLSVPPEKTALTGKLLLASPFMNDSMFAGSVVLISAHSKDAGAIGFIINQPTSEILSDNYAKWLSNTSASSKIFTTSTSSCLKNFEMFSLEISSHAEVGSGRLPFGLRWPKAS